MLGTVDPAARGNAPATEAETRPMRLFVPTERRSDYWLPLEDTLRASDLGITRQTTDEELNELVDQAREMLTSAGLTEDPSFWMYRIRDALRHPRDIIEAREWGFRIPRRGENEGELFPEERAELEEQLAAAEREVARCRDLPGQLPTAVKERLVAAEADVKRIKAALKRLLNWWWAYDPERVETREQRRARYMSDHRLIDMKGYARAVLRAYITVKDRKVKSDAVRRILEEAEHRREQAILFARHNTAFTVEQAEEYLLAEARKDILKATPKRRDRAGQSDLWFVSDALHDGRDNERLSEWYEFSKIKQTGRPRGSKTRKRRTPA